jgi:hypothetical protein
MQIALPDVAKVVAPTELSYCIQHLAAKKGVYFIPNVGCIRGESDVSLRCTNDASTSKCIQKRDTMRVISVEVLFVHSTFGVYL